MAPLPIMKSMSDGVELDVDNLNEIKNILKQEKCDFVSIVAVMGCWRTGKSFLLDLLMRYLRTRAAREAQERTASAPPQLRKPQDRWLYNGDDIDERPLPKWVQEGDKNKISEGGGKDGGDAKGFGWKSGKARCTTGIWLWSKPFVLHDEKGRRIGVLLMDTQGAWDPEMSQEQSATIFGLTALLSSKLIYNIQNQIDADKLGNLDYFTSFAEKACGFVDQPGTSRKKPFGHLELLIRDWSHYEDGWDDVRCREQLKEHLHEFLYDEKVNEKDRAERLGNCFSQIGCFGLSHPGLPVTRPTYDGSMAPIDPNFWHLLDSFTERFFGESFPKPSAPLGVELTTESFTKTIENFAKAFADKKDMTLGLREALVKVQMNEEKVKLVEEYRTWVTNAYPDHTVIDPEILIHDMQEQKERYRKNLITMLKPWHLKDDQEKVHVDELTREMDLASDAALERNQQQVDNATLKVVGAPVVGFGVYVAACHAWFMTAAGGAYGYLMMQKHAKRHQTELCAPEVYAGVFQDASKFAKNRWRDVQAMQIAAQRLQVDKVAEIVIGAGAKAYAAGNAAAQANGAIGNNVVGNNVIGNQAPVFTG